jgi:cell cycle checkpoint protein
LQYPGIERTLKVQLTDINGVLTDCSIRTREADDEDELNFHFREYEVNNKIVLKSEVLKEILTEMQSFEENVQILISPNQPYFEFHTENGIIGDLTCV